LAQSEVRVAIFDSPVDTEHPDVQRFLDVITSTKPLRIGQSLGLSPSQMNDAALIAFRARFKDRKSFDELVEFLELLQIVHGGRKPEDFFPSADKSRISLIMVRGILKNIFYPSFRSQLNDLEGYLHGTHVAGLVTAGLSPQQLKLSNIPLINGPGSRVGFFQVLVRGSDGKRLKLEAEIKKLTQFIKENKIQIVSASIGYSRKAALTSIRSKVGIFTRLVLGWKIRLNAKKDLHDSRQLFSRLAQDNRETIFVIAAGNDGQDVSDEDEGHISSIEEPNIVNVGATDFQGKIAKFSNISDQHIEIAAPGAAIKSAKVGGGTIVMSGTSMATPIVTNRLVRILSANPRISVLNATRRLYEKHSISRPGLEGKVEGARFLVPNILAESDEDLSDAVIEAALKRLDQQTYFAPGKDCAGFLRLLLGS